MAAVNFSIYTDTVHLGSPMIVGKLGRFYRLTKSRINIVWAEHLPISTWLNWEIKAQSLIFARKSVLVTENALVWVLIRCFR